MASMALFHFLWLNSIPLNICAGKSGTLQSMGLQRDVTEQLNNMYHIFIHSPVDEHLVSFHVLVFVNSASVNISMHAFF